MNRRKCVVGLLWHSVNSDNLGVGALTLANVAIIRREAARLGAEVEFVIMGWGDRREPYLSGPDISMVPLRPREHFLRPHRLAAIIRRCDVVFDIGYGDSFADLYGAKRFVWFLITKMMVLFCRVPLVLSPQTIGPFRRGWVRLLARQVLRRASAVFARDRLSYEVIEEMGVVRRHEATDVAFELPADDKPLPPAGKIRIGINISGLLFNGGREAARRFGLEADYAAAVRRLVSHFTQENECEVHLIGHVFSGDPEEDDRRAIRRMAAEFPDAIIAPAFASPTAAKAYISAMDFFTGARMHACIAAFSSGVPVVPMAYSRKFSGLFGSLGYGWVADCTKEDTAAVVGKVVQGFSERVLLREQVRGGRKAARAGLREYQSVVARCLTAARGETVRAAVSRAA